MTFKGGRITFLFLLVFSSLVPAQTYLWDIIAGGTYPDQGNAVTTDASGNVYVIGGIQSTNLVDVDPGPGIVNVSGSGILVAKYDANKNCIWAFCIQTTSTSPNTLGADIK